MSDSELTSLRNEFCLLLVEDLTQFRTAIFQENWERVIQRANQAAGDAGLHDLIEISRLMRELEEFAKKENSRGALELLESLTQVLPRSTEESSS